MKIKSVGLLAIFLIIAVNPLYSQGFNWQYSYRFPTSSPRMFYSFGTNVEFSDYSSNLNFSEKIITCCRFKTGSATNSNIYLGGEYWLSGGIRAINAQVGYKHVSGSFEANPDPVYYIGDTLFTKIKSDIKVNYLTADFGIKSRIKLTHFFYSGGLGFDILLDNSFTNKEIVTSANHSFNDGTTERKINSGKVSSLSDIVLYPKIGFGCDINLGLGLYAEPKISLGVNLNNITSCDRWRTLDLCLGISIFKGFR